MDIRIVCLFVLILVVAGRPQEDKDQKNRYPCPFGFFQLPGQKNCYRFSTEREHWYGAVQKYHAMDAFLVEIESKAESKAITKYLLGTLPPESQEGDHDIWIGLSDHKKEGFWRWEETGDLVSKPGNKNGNFNNWAPHEPNSIGPVNYTDADCARINNNDLLTALEWKWADWSCNAKFYYLCEYEELPITEEHVLHRRK